MHAGPARMPEAAGNVFLVGPMGSGKTTIGQRLADLLGLEFLDCDRELEARTGASVSLIFDVEGECGFRDREAQIIEELAARDGILLATGGGAVIRAGNREVLRRRGLVVYLRTTVDQQLRRLSRDRSRPLLQTDDRRERLQELARQRDPLYEEVADIEFPARNRGPDAVARQLADVIRTHRERA
jgi:shikimate kinase